MHHKKGAWWWSLCLLCSLLLPVHGTASPEQKKAHIISEEMPHFFAGGLTQAWSMIHMAWGYVEQNKIDEADVLLQKSSVIFKRYAKENPLLQYAPLFERIVLYHRYQPDAVHDLSFNLRQTLNQNLPESRLFSHQRFEPVSIFTTLPADLSIEMQPEKKRPTVLSWLDKNRTFFKDVSPILAQIYILAGEKYRQAAAWSHAFKAYSQALVLLPDVVGPLLSLRVSVLLRAASVAEYLEAEKSHVFSLLKKALLSQENMLGKAHPETVVTLAAITMHLLRHHQKEALSWGEKTLALDQRYPGALPQEQKIALYLWFIRYFRAAQAWLEVDRYLPWLQRLIVSEKMSQTAYAYPFILLEEVEIFHEKAELWRAEVGLRQLIIMLAAQSEVTPYWKNQLKNLHNRHRQVVAQLNGKSAELLTLKTLQDYVREMQRRLSALNLDTGGVDGYFGNQTLRAMRRFEKRMALTPIAQPGKIKALQRLLQRLPPVSPESASVSVN
ncbi:peptidoglycan-binding domain-containing protein [Magnetococcales bacterium HHB-1]